MVKKKIDFVKSSINQYWIYLLVLWGPYIKLTKKYH